MSNYSSLIAPAGMSTGRPSRIKRRPSLPRLSSFTADPQLAPPELELPISDFAESESGPSSPSTGITTPSGMTAQDEEYPTVLQDKDITENEKLAAILEEYGDIAGLMEGDEPERMLAESKGSLFK